MAARAARAASSDCRPAWACSRSVSSALIFSASGSRNPRRSSLEDPSLCLLEPALLQRDPRQPDLRRGSVGVESQVPRCIFPRPPSGRSLPVTSLRGELSRPAWARAGRATSGSPTRAGHRRSRRRPCRRERQRPPGSTARQIERPARARVGIDLGQHELAVVLLRQLLEHRAQHAARAAPRGPEVDHHRHGCDRSITSCSKVLRRRFDHKRGRRCRVAHRIKCSLNSPDPVVSRRSVTPLATRHASAV